MFGNIANPLGEMILRLGSFINGIFSMPSQLIPLMSSNMVLVLVSILFGYFFGKNANLGMKTVTITVSSILFYCTLKYIGV